LTRKTAWQPTEEGGEGNPDPNTEGLRYRPHDMQPGSMKRGVVFERPDAERRKKGHKGIRTQDYAAKKKGGRGSKERTEAVCSPQ